MSEVPEKIQEVAADVVGEMAHQAEEMEQYIRSLNRAKVQFTALGYAMGAATGAFIAFKVAYSRAETKFSRIADEEIAEMREHYQAKALAAEGESQKGDLEEIVAERGYVSNDDEKPPMAVTPPPKVVDAAKEAAIESEDEAAGEPPDVVEEPEVRNVFRDADESASVMMDSWDYHEERRKRTPDFPYVIHYDERNEFEEYSEVTLTYYEADDVLCNERDEIIPVEERDKMVGEGNLSRFGHGSNDPSIVYVRNDPLELMLEVVRSPNSYAEEVHGFNHTSYSRNLERMRQREREELDDG